MGDGGRRRARLRGASWFAAVALVALFVGCARVPPSITTSARVFPSAVPSAGTPPASATPSAHVPTADSVPSATITAAPVSDATPTWPHPTPPSGGSPSPPAGRVNCAVVACVALTFDDGPGDHTARLLDMLAAEHVQATFFLRGDHVEKHPGLVGRMRAEGHDIGNHTYSHPELTKVSAAVQRTQIDRGAAIIREAGAAPTLFRPPYGSYDATTKQLAGLPIVLWDIDTLDWKTKSTDRTIASAVNGARGGSIVLMHDVHGTTVDAVPAIVRGLRDRGFRLVTTHEILGRPAPGSVSSHGIRPA